MKKIILIEDMEKVALEIKTLLSEFDLKLFHNSRSFLVEFTKQNFKEFLSQTDFFLLDFNLGDGTLISSKIYEYILLNKKQDAVLCCISSFGQQIVDINCKDIAHKYNKKSPFDVYLKKNSVLIANHIKALA